MKSKHTPEPWSNAGIKAERDKLREELTEMTRQRNLEEADAARSWIEAARLRSVNAELLAALQRLSAAAMAYSSLDDEVAEARAALVKAKS